MARRVAAQSERQARPRRHRRRLVAGDDGMKPHGPIPPGFAADAGGMLLIGGRRADALAGAGADTPLFVYDSVMLAARVAAWRDRKTVVSGKGGAVRVDLRGPRNNKKNNIN